VVFFFFGKSSRFFSNYFPQKKATLDKSRHASPGEKGGDINHKAQREREKERNTRFKRYVNQQKSTESDADRGGAEKPGRISNVFDMPRDLQSAVLLLLRRNPLNNNNTILTRPSYPARAREGERERQ
jgi:hypothetical protein